MSGMFAWAPMPGAGVDSVPITSASVRPPSGADGVLSGDFAPFLGKIHGPCHRPFWLHRYRHRQYKMSCYRHHTLPRLVSHTDPSLLMGIGAAQSQRADAVPGAGLKRRGARDKCKRDGAGRPRCGEQGAAAEAARLGTRSVFGDPPPRADGERQHGGWQWQLRSAAVLPFRRPARVTASGGGSAPSRRQKMPPRCQDPTQTPITTKRKHVHAIFGTTPFYKTDLGFFLQPMKLDP